MAAALDDGEPGVGNGTEGPQQNDRYYDVMYKFRVCWDESTVQADMIRN